MPRKKLTRKRVFEIIQIGEKGDTASRVFDLCLALIIIIDIAVSVCLTFSELRRYFPIFMIIDTASVMFFIIEYILRLWTADFLFGETRRKSAFQYMVSPNGLVEICSIIPYFLPLIFPKGLIAFRMFRAIRILRLLRANSYSDALATIMIVLKRKRGQILSSMLIIFAIMLMSSLLMFGFEHEAQPDVFKNAFSGIWWATSTLLTVGYGDIYPVTIWGKIASIIITFLGVGMVAIPTGILSAGFTEYMSEQRDSENESENEKELSFCPYCGEKLPKQ